MLFRSKGKVVDTITIGENGVGISKDLPYGSYTVTQISGQAGTILVDSWTVTVNEHDKVYLRAYEPMRFRTAMDHGLLPQSWDLQDPCRRSA